MKKLIILFLSLHILTGTFAENSSDYEGRHFSLSFTDSLSGDLIDTEEMAGKVIIVHFWFSECSPCKNTTPYLVNLYEKYGDDNIEFIGVNLDEDESIFLDYCRENRIEWPQYFEKNRKWDTSVALEWGVEMTPMFFVIDNGGKIVKSTANHHILDQIIQNNIKG